MKLFLLTLVITFCTLLGVTLFFSYCKRRAQNSKHGLTGMCHRSGDTACCSSSRNPDIKPLKKRGINDHRNTQRN